MFAGWEGVGLCSYLLINFWFTRIQSNKAAIKAMIINRIGDFGLMLGILTIFVNYQAVDYSTVFAVTPYFKDKVFTFLNFDIHLLTLVGLLLFVGSVGKSAQIGLHTWLPDAMEGPTPVSALIHAATMVTAGVFLLARSSPIFEYAPDALVIITISGAMTSFFAATVGLLQNDLKRIIAYSTCSQLGYMIFACGLSNYAVGIFHLVNHASFKALLFLGAGSVIHAVGDEQDIRKMGGLKKLVPFTYSVMMIGSLALMGFPFLTGFYSKDVILEVAYGKYDVSGHFAYILGLLAAFFTAFYSIRLIHLTFLSSPNGYKSVIFSAHDSPLMMVIPLAVLTVPSIFAGYLMKDMFIGLGTDFWGNSLLVLPENMNRIDSEFIPQIWKLMPVCFSVFGAGLSFFLYSINMRALYDIKRTDIGRNLYNFINRKWLFDRVYNDWITQPFLYFSYHISYKLIDRGILEFFGPMGLTKLLSKESKNMHKTHTGFLYHYAFIILMGGTVLLIFLDLCHNWLTYFKIIFLCVNIFLLTEYIETFKNR
jgi:NADH-ubiquinone oxidoreductase chain 5